ncbi:MAG: cytochrome c biogenesis protein CcdA [Alkalinema sp. RU_4_3]|nr:cytochrome c biogenesis protein CcdA [Alkalinema sp. RU_4_3]
MANLSLGLAFLGGVVTVFSPCILPVLPILVGRSLSAHRMGPVVLVAGLIAGFAIFGSLLGVTGTWLAGLVGLLRSVSIGLLLGMGLLLLFPQLGYRLFSYLPIQRWVKPVEGSGLWAEFVIGAQLGLLWTPCAGPVLGSILLLSINQRIGEAFLLLLIYGFGAGLPMLLLAYGGRGVSRRFLSLRAGTVRLTQVGGGLIVVTAIAILLGWDLQVQLFLAPLFPRQML